VLAMAAAMTGLLWQHRPVVIELKLNGLSTGVIWRALVVEAAVLFCVGTLAGAAFSLIGQPLGTRGVQVVTGFPVVDGLRWNVTLATIAIVIGSSMLAVACSGYLVARVQPDWRE
jgi:putative ABC transport system permease protein